MQRAYLASTRLLSAALVAIGIAMVVVTVANGGGPVAVGVIFGVLLALVGAGRLWLARGAERKPS